MALHMRNYPSSVESNLPLFAEFYLPDTPKPLLLFFHGWHYCARQARKDPGLEPLQEHFFVVNVDMRGRDKHPGKPDASGHELIDGLDALDYARRTWPEAIRTEPGAYVCGGSGGGGNTLALIGKAPDLFTAAVSFAGITDYGAQYTFDQKGGIRDEMEGKGWIGGSPETNPEGYRARGGLFVLENVITPTLVIHGRNDPVVSIEQAERYLERARQLRKSCITPLYHDRGHNLPGWDAPLDHLRSHVTAPILPPAGTRLVHSFIACRAFWVVLDDPARMGRLTYELNRTGCLASLSFSQDPGLKPVEGVRVRIFNPVKNLNVESGGKRSECQTCHFPAFTDFIWNGAGEWNATVAT